MAPETSVLSSTFQCPLGWRVCNTIQVLIADGTAVHGRIFSYFLKVMLRSQDLVVPAIACLLNVWISSNASVFWRHWPFSSALA